MINENVWKQRGLISAGFKQCLAQDYINNTSICMYTYICWCILYLINIRWCYTWMHCKTALHTKPYQKQMLFRSAIKWKDLFILVHLELLMPIKSIAQRNKLIWEIFIFKYLFMGFSVFIYDLESLFKIRINICSGVWKECLEHLFHISRPSAML